MVELTNIDAGEHLTEPGRKAPFTSDGTGSQGDLVKFDANGDVTPTTAAADDYIGVLHETPDAAGDTVTVVLGGVFAVTVDSAVSEGDILEPSGTTAGRADVNAQGANHQVDEGGTAVYRLALQQMQALTAAGGAGEDVAVKFK